MENIKKNTRIQSTKKTIRTNTHKYMYIIIKLYGKDRERVKKEEFLKYQVVL